jgi:hypothetical protein
VAAHCISAASKAHHDDWRVACELMPARDGIGT